PTTPVTAPASPASATARSTSANSRARRRCGPTTFARSSTAARARSCRSVLKVTQPVGLRLREAAAAYRAVHEGKLDRRAVALLARLVKDDRVVRVVERLRLTDQQAVIRALAACDEADRLARNSRLLGTKQEAVRDR